MRLPGFVGPSNVLSSTLEDCELSINVLPEHPGVGTPKDEGWLPRRPGLRFLFSVGTGRCSGFFEINGRAFGVSGTNFFEFFVGGTFTIWGTVAFDVNCETTMCSGGTASDQVMLIAGFTGYVFTLSTNTLAQITDGDFPINPFMCEFFAGYYLTFTVDTRSIYWSALEDATSWDPLDVIERSWAGDNITGIKRNGTHIWVIGNRTSEVLYLNGGIEVFAPAQESLIEHGGIAPFSIIRLPQGIACLDYDERGVGQVVIFKGLQPDPTSTYAINLEQQQQAGVLQWGVASAIQMNGHLWYVLMNPRFDFRLTPVFDITEGLWHHWAHWNTTTCQWVPWRGNTHVSAFQKHYVGDRLSGAVYELSMDTLTDELADV